MCAASWPSHCHCRSSSTIESEWVTGVTEHNAVLHATIDPNGLETAYKLQIDTTGNFNFDQNDTCPLHPPTIACGQAMITGDPLPPGLVEPPESSIPAGIDSQEVSVSLASIDATLQPHTTYHYRAIAASGVPEVEGPSQTFTTEPGPPSIEGEAVSNITSTGATLEATIDPQAATNGVFYQFQLLHDPGEAPTEIACPSSVPGYSACVGPPGLRRPTDRVDLRQRHRKQSASIFRARA